MTITDLDLSARAGLVATHDRGLTYPFGGMAPGMGEVMAAAPGIRWVRLAMPGPLKHVNCWLVDDADARGGGVAVVDTGMNLRDQRAAWETAFAGPLAGTRVTRVFGTHFHPDHVGLAGWLCRGHDAELWMTRGEWLTARMLALDPQARTSDEIFAFWRMAGWDEAQLARKREADAPNFSRIVTPLPAGYRRLVDGQTLPIGDREWRVVTGCGHSPEHACLLDEAAGVLIAGDQVLPRISSNVSLFIIEPHADPLGEWLDSIAKLKTLPGDLLVLPGHGDPFYGLHTRLDALADEHRQRLDDLAVHLAEPRRAVDCFAVLFERPVGEDMLAMASGEALAHLRHLELAGRAVREMDDGVAWWRAG